MDPMLAMIFLWPCIWAPNNYQLCWGQTINIQQYEALFSLLGTVFGGNASTSFMLPDLRGSVPIGFGTSATSNQNYQLGKSYGDMSGTFNATATGSVTLTTNNLPAHTHSATFSASGGTSKVSIAVPADPVGPPSSNVPSATSVLSMAMINANAGAKIYNSAPNAATMTTLAPFEVLVPAGGGTVANANTGGGQPIQFSLPVSGKVSTMQPSLAMAYLIAMNGIYPDRP